MAEIYRHQQAQEIGSVGSVEVAYSLVKSTLSVMLFGNPLMISNLDHNSDANILQLFGNPILQT